MRDFIVVDVVGCLKVYVKVFLTQFLQSCPNATIVLCFARILQRQGNDCSTGPNVLCFIIAWNSLNWKEGKKLAFCVLCVVHVLWVNET